MLMRQCQLLEADWGLQAIGEDWVTPKKQLAVHGWEQVRVHVHYLYVGHGLAHICLDLSLVARSEPSHLSRLSAS